jgi:outer membrane lipoprotein
MANRLQAFFLLILFFFLTGCAHVISKDLRVKADSSLTFKEVFENPNTYQGKTVIWGGEIIKTTNQKDGTTLMEIFQLPLSRRGEPNALYPSGGRFLVLTEKYLDSYLFERGRKITVGGEILGEEFRKLGEMDYRYPLLSGKQIHLWREYYHPGPYYHRPYYYDPWWDYPIYWRFHFYYHRHR